ncbi:FAD-dependent monooxygenase [Actibacterium sp.]|uniref:FAD-dependent monooxygenase n=1 Tax=Actibacterium sp. TaxID=1872125 RepID=UPI003561AF30
MKIAIVGGGPAGLFLGRLIRRNDPSIEIDIFEQNPEKATYGFGVTLAGDARQRLANIDAEVIQRLSERMVFNTVQGISLQDERLLLRYANSGGAIERLQLLEVLGELCRDVGLEVQYGKRIDSEADLAEYDLVVGADGANSAVRGLWENSFRPRHRLLGNRFAWYGVNKALMPNALSFRNADGGCYIGHYYAYTADKSTFVAECDARTWTECGFDRMSDDERKARIEQIFDIELEGEKLQENKSVWRQFDAITVENWHHGKAVLIGDALRVAHFSIGSGTRLAMDDALALFEAIVEHGSDIEALKASYVERRKPTRDLFTVATVKSFEWYEDVRQHMHTDLADFAHAFLKRTGRVDDERLKTYAPEFHYRYIARQAAEQSAVTK